MLKIDIIKNPNCCSVKQTHVCAFPCVALVGVFIGGPAQGSGLLHIVIKLLKPEKDQDMVEEKYRERRVYSE